MISRLDQIVYVEGVGLAHEDERRAIYNPEKLLEGLDKYGPWFNHNIIRIKQTGLQLGNHHHDYSEVFFTPTGDLEFLFTDKNFPKDVREFSMNQGSRLFIPEDIDHRVIGSKGAILMGYGNVQFDPKRLISSSSEVLKVFGNHF